MPEYIVVCCYQCKLFQGQQKNKQKKFKCKVCGEKQSVRHIFAVSDYPKDIRGIVQELNQKRGEMREMETSSQPEIIPPKSSNSIPSLETATGESCWTQFLDQKIQVEKEGNNEEADDNQYITDTSLLQPIYKRKKEYSSHKQKAKQQPSLQQEMEPSSSMHSSSKQQISSFQKTSYINNSNRNGEEIIKPKSTELSFDSLLHDLEQGDVFITDLNDVSSAKEEQPVKQPVVNKDSMWSAFM